ncbi:MAG TPA: SRPBCC domain-containing protein [Chthoniobacterales bacterium]|jgi:uncharacterized protein YndB with AHSA1/START domain|nr:SRPBCC domain-containing protein [Chthoniobacterales bacterium]
MTTTSRALFLILSSISCFAGPGPGALHAADDSSLMEGKRRTDRSIVLEATIPAPPAEVFRLWTTVDGVKKFFAPEARIDAQIGGRYEMIFAPGEDPDGSAHGTKGARILKLVPERELAFEWVAFAGDKTRGRSSPPYAPPAERDVRPLPTWVDLSFAPVAENADRTLLRFAHYGFGSGERWAESHRWFTAVWKAVLDQLAAYCEKQRAAKPDHEPE